MGVYSQETLLLEREYLDILLEVLVETLEDIPSHVHDLLVTGGGVVQDGEEVLGDHADDGALLGDSHVATGEYLFQETVQAGTEDAAGGLAEGVHLGQEAEELVEVTFTEIHQKTGHVGVGELAEVGLEGGVADHAQTVLGGEQHLEDEGTGGQEACVEHTGGGQNVR